MSGAALHPTIAGAFAREIGRAPSGRLSWHRLDLDVIEQRLKPYEADIVVALAAAHGGGGRLAPPSSVRFQIARSVRVERGDFDLISGAWRIGDHTGRGLLDFAAAMWTRPGARILAEQAGERLCALLGRAVVAALVTT